MELSKKQPSLDVLSAMTPQELLRWASETHGERAAIITSFQNAGCVLIDMAHRDGLHLRVVTIDPLRLHQETYEFIERFEARYGLTVERFRPDPGRLERMMARHGEFLFFDGKSKQEYCCEVRKVEPNRRALATVDVWFTGLRRDQSAARSALAKAAIVHRDNRPVIKLSPLADWTEQEVRGYMKEHGVPHNPLYDKGYTSIGCSICTTPTLTHEQTRAGRWRWFNHMGSGHGKECGIHTDGSGI